MSEQLSDAKLREKIQNLRTISRIQKKRSLVPVLEPSLDQAPIPTPLTKQEREALNEKMQQLQSIGVNQAITQTLVEQTDQSMANLNRKVEALRDYTSLTGVTIQPEDANLYGFGRDWVGFDLASERDKYITLLTQLKISKADVKSIDNVLDQALRGVAPTKIQVQKILNVSRRLADLDDRLDINKIPVSEVSIWQNLKDNVIPMVQEFLDALPSFWKDFSRDLEEEAIRPDAPLVHPSKRAPGSGLNATLAGSAPGFTPKIGAKQFQYMSPAELLDIPADLPPLESSVKEEQKERDEFESKLDKLMADDSPSYRSAKRASMSAQRALLREKRKTDLLDQFPATPKGPPSPLVTPESLDNVKRKLKLTPPPSPREAPKPVTLEDVVANKVADQKARVPKVITPESSLNQRKAKYMDAKQYTMKTLQQYARMRGIENVGTKKETLAEKLAKLDEEEDRKKAFDLAQNNKPVAIDTEVRQQPASQKGQGFTKVSKEGWFGQLWFDMDKFYKMKLHAKKHGRVVAKGPLSHDLFLLLTQRFKPKHDYSEDSLEAFKKLVDLAELPKLTAKCGKGKVLKGLIAPKKKKELQTQPPVRSTKTKFVYYDKPEELLERLNIIMGSIDAGNNSNELKEEASQLLDVLKSKEAISKIQYESLMESLM